MTEQYLYSDYLNINNERDGCVFVT